MISRMPSKSPLDRLAGSYIELDESRDSDLKMDTNVHHRGHLSDGRRDLSPQLSPAPSSISPVSPVSTSAPFLPHDQQPASPLPREKHGEFQEMHLGPPPPGCGPLPLRRQQTSIPLPSTGWWYAEMISWVISAVTLAVMCALLAFVDGHSVTYAPLPLKITLNSLMAFLATLMKAAMVVPVAESISQLKWLWLKREGAGSVDGIQTFDEASRGLWGSLKLLWATKGVHLAKLGALITLLVLGVDPFIQQIIAYPTRNMPVPLLNSSIPIAINYTDYSYGAIMALKTPTLEMKAAIIQGLLDTNTNPQDDFPLTPTCATGNCTWPDTYYSLGVCTKCANTTSQMTVSCTSPSDFTSYCNYTLPNGFMFNGYYAPNLVMNATGTYPTVHFNNTQPTISSISTIRALHDLSYTSFFGVVSNECVLYWCVNELRASVSSGIFAETIVSSHTNDSNPTTGDISISVAAPNETLTFTVGQYAHNALQQYFWSYWSGNVTGAVGRASSSRSDDNLDALFTLGDDGSGTGAQEIGGENNTIAAVAASMSKTVRTTQIFNTSVTVTALNASSGDWQPMAEGIIWTSETFIDIRWPWIVLPGLLELLTLGLLVGTILQSRRSGVAVWKSSVLPLLMFDEVRSWNFRRPGKPFK